MAAAAKHGARRLWAIASVLCGLTLALPLAPEEWPVNWADVHEEVARICPEDCRAACGSPDLAAALFGRAHPSVLKLIWTACTNDAAACTRDMVEYACAPTVQVCAAAAQRGSNEASTRAFVALLDGCLASASGVAWGESGAWVDCDATSAVVWMVVLVMGVLWFTTMASYSGYSQAKPPAIAASRSLWA
jgi:hypothetical protein